MSYVTVVSFFALLINVVLKNNSKTKFLFSLVLLEFLDNSSSEHFSASGLENIIIIVNTY